MTMSASDWVLSERVEILRLETTPSKRPPVSYHLIQLIADVCSGQTNADDAASRISSLVLEQQHDLVDTYHESINCIISAAQQINDAGSSERLAALIASLARLPDAKNTGAEPLHYNDGSLDWTIPPGDTITFYDGRLWADLPSFGLQMRETWNGPKATMGVVASAAAADARDRWTNANAFCAHFVKRYGAIPPLSCYRIYALWTISSALEYGIKSRRGEDLWLDIPAAAKWVEVLGSEMRYWIDDYDGWLGAGGGTLWKAEEHGYGFSPQRWAFWRERFRRLATDKMLDEDSQRVAAEAAGRME